MIDRRKTPIQAPPVVGCVYRPDDALLIFSQRIEDDGPTYVDSLWRVRVVCMLTLRPLFEVFSSAEHDGVIEAVKRLESMFG